MEEAAVFTFINLRRELARTNTPEPRDSPTLVACDRICVCGSSLIGGTCSRNLGCPKEYSPRRPRATEYRKRVAWLVLMVVRGAVALPLRC